MFFVLIVLWTSMTQFSVIQGQFCSGGKPCLCGVLAKQGTSYIRENRFYLGIKEKDKT